MATMELREKIGNSIPPVRVLSLSKSFGRQAVLKGISLEVAQGETLSVLGRSGTGKSVLLKLMIGLDKPDSGSIRIYGEDVTKMPLEQLNEVRKKIGFLFQQAALYDSLTVRRERRLSAAATRQDVRRSAKQARSRTSRKCRNGPRRTQNASRSFRWNAEASGLSTGPGAGSRHTIL